MVRDQVCYVVYKCPGQAYHLARIASEPRADSEADRLLAELAVHAGDHISQFPILLRQLSDAVMGDLETPAIRFCARPAVTGRPRGAASGVVEFFDLLQQIGLRVEPRPGDPSFGGSSDLSGVSNPDGSLR